MFGYLKPDKPYLYLKDETLYNALYCGICKSIKQVSGNVARFALSYDVAFLSALAHNVCGIDVDIKKKRCIAHPIKSRPIASVDEISKKLASLNMILAHYKLCDDIIDENKGNFKSAVISKGYKRAKKAEPEMDEIVHEGYKNLLKLEKQGTKSVDIVSDTFATLMAKISNILFGEFSSENTYNLTYALGKWVYLIDALDDYDKDIKNKSYNVFYNAYGQNTYAEFIEKNSSEIAFIFNTVLSQIAETYKNIPKKFNGDLVENILFKGIPKTTVSILSKGKKSDKEK
ncbi:MAG: hypothetical protein IKV61_01215 [Clostridia bacterium]|nr:hypothetical protein [Clostridia bacterium]